MRITLLLALVFAPFLGAVFGAGLTGLLGVLDAAHIGVSPMRLFFAQFKHWLPWIAAATWLSTIVFGLPLHIGLQRNRSFSAIGYWGGGLVLGSIVVLIGALATLGDLDALGDALSDSIQYMLVAGPTGGATGLLAWLIRRPDRDVAETL